LSRIPTTSPALHDRYGSWLCENAAARQGERTDVSSNASECARVVSAFDMAGFEKNYSNGFSACRVFTQPGSMAIEQFPRHVSHAFDCRPPKNNAKGHFQTLEMTASAWCTTSTESRMKPGPCPCANVGGSQIAVLRLTFTVNRPDQNFCESPTKKPRRAPYCGANSPMPLPVRSS
jgi:hypothetical protein